MSKTVPTKWTAPRCFLGTPKISHRGVKFKRYGRVGGLKMVAEGDGGGQKGFGEKKGPRKRKGGGLMWF